MITVKPTKEEAKLITWLRKALSDDDRPTLTQIHVKNGRTETCDGCRAHIAETPECFKTQDFAEALLTPLAKSTRADIPNEFEANTETLNYPDLEQVTPKAPFKYVIGIDPKYLSEALSIFPPGEPVILEFRTPREPVIVRSNSTPAKAIIMPMFIEETENQA
jgi:hypothetical protein